jgi:hypothetical protein
VKPRINNLAPRFNPKLVSLQIPIGLAAVIVEYLGHELSVAEELVEDEPLSAEYRNIIAATIATVQTAIEKGASL